MTFPQQTRERESKRVPLYRQLIDYDALPEWALVSISEVQVLTRMRKTKIEQLIKDGKFRAPTKHGGIRVWPIGYVRAWCVAMGQPSNEEGGE